MAALVTYRLSLIRVYQSMISRGGFEMVNHCRMSVLITLLVGILSGPAFAGTTLVNYNGVAGANIAVALEAMGADRTVAFNGTGNTATTIGVGYRTGQQLANGNLLLVTLVGSKFPATAINVCGVGAAGVADGIIANSTPSTDGTFLYPNLHALAGNVTAGGLFYSTNGPCNAAATANITPIIAATPTAGAATIQIKIQTSGGVDLDTSAPKTLATITPQFSESHHATAHIIDYLATPFNGTRLITGATASNITADGAVAGTSNNVAVTTAALDFGVAVGNAAVGAQNATGLTVSTVLSAQDTANWQGVSRMYLVPGNVTACAIGNNVSTVDAAPLIGTVAVNVTAAGFNGDTIGTKQFALCVEADGTSSLQGRTISLSENVNVTGTGANGPAGDPYDTAMTWTVNAYQALLPWVVNSAAAPTFCLINNNDTATAGSALLDVTSSEKTILIANAALGTVPPSTSRLLTFTGNSASLAGGTPVDLTTLGANDRYSAKVSVTTHPSNVTVSCQQTDPITGAKRPVPVLTSGALTTYFKQ
jgi:hypothetical protein